MKMRYQLLASLVTFIIGLAAFSPGCSPAPSHKGAQTASMYEDAETATEPVVPANHAAGHQEADHWCYVGKEGHTALDPFMRSTFHITVTQLESPEADLSPIQRVFRKKALEAFPRIWNAQQVMPDYHLVGPEAEKAWGTVYAVGLAGWLE